MAKWYVIEAQRQVNGLRRRLSELGYAIPTDSAVDVELIAEAYLDCTVFRRPQLTERLALAHLQQTWGLSYDVDSTADHRLAGALYVTADGSRAIFLEASDVLVRQRFSLAHELGHLLLEAEAGLEPEPNLLAGVPESQHGEGVGLRKYGRCPPTAIGWRESKEEASDTRSAHGGSNVEQGESGFQRSPTDTQSLLRDEAGLSQTDAPPPGSGAGIDRVSSKNVREWRANFFAAELLMPYDGVRRLLQGFGGGIGFRTDTDLNRFVVSLAETYHVSPISARLRLIKDLKITPRARQSNRELFE